MTNPTPTPWRTGETDNGRSDWIFAEGQVVDCEFLSAGRVNVANAALIVRAVNTIEPLTVALQAAVEALRSGAGPEEKLNAIRDGRAALALAKSGFTHFGAERVNVDPSWGGR